MVGDSRHYGVAPAAASVGGDGVGGFGSGGNGSYSDSDGSRRDGRTGDGGGGGGAAGPPHSPWTRARVMEVAAAATSVVKLLLGAASFGLPWAFAQAGVCVSVAMVVALGGLSAFTIHLLLDTRRRLAGQVGSSPLPPPRASGDHGGGGTGHHPALASAVAFAGGMPPATAATPLLLSCDGSDAEAPPPASPLMLGSPPSPAPAAAEADYATMAAAALGLPAGAYVRLATCVSCIGACAGYVAFIAGVLVAVVPEPAPSPRRMMAVLLPLFVLVSQVRRWSHLAAASLAGNAAFAVAVCCVVAAAWPRLGAGDALVDPAAATGLSSPGTVALWASPGSWAVAFGPTAFLFTIHYVAVPLASTVSVAGDFERVVLPFAFGLCVAVNVAFAAVCAVAYAGVGVEDNIFRNVLGDAAVGGRPLVLAVAGGVCVDLLFTYTLLLAAAREYVEKALFGDADADPSPPPRSRRLAESALRAGLAATTVGVAAAVPHFARLTSLAGGVSDASLAFVLPPLMAAAVQRRGRARAADTTVAVGGTAFKPLRPDRVEAALVALAAAGGGLALVAVTQTLAPAAIGAAAG
ncbi:hypothetical protein MMPV_009261 [Pyropia vietnamensis]